MTAETTDILVINPGSTSSKIAVYRDGKEFFVESLSHDPEKLLSYGGIAGQMDYRKDVIKKVLEKKNYDIKQLKACLLYTSHIMLTQQQEKLGK